MLIGKVSSGMVMGAGIVVSERTAVRSSARREGCIVLRMCALMQTVHRIVRVRYTGWMLLVRLVTVTELQKCRFWRVWSYQTFRQWSHSHFLELCPLDRGIIKSSIYLEDSCDFHPLKKSIREIHVRKIARRMSLLSFWQCKSVKFISTVPSHTEVNSSSENALSYWLHAPFASFHRGGDVVIVTCMYGTSQFPR